MKVSIIIPTYNAGKHLNNFLISLQNQSIKFHELIIVDSSSTDETLKIANQYTNNVLSIDKSEFDHGGTRAKAAEIATGDILIFLTQDALPANTESIENILKVFNNQNVTAAYGRQLWYEDTNLFGRHLREFNYPKKSFFRSQKDIIDFGIKTAQLSNSFSAYRKNVLMKLGNFKSQLILGEDVYMGAKMILAGHTLAYVADAQVFHSHSYTIMEEAKRYFDIGVFHMSENWILKEFGKPEGEGMRYVKSEFNYLIKHHAWNKIHEFILRNTMKYLGYKLGQKYQLLPKNLRLAFSMHRSWWSKNNLKKGILGILFIPIIIRT